MFKQFKVTLTTEKLEGVVLGKAVANPSSRPHTNRVGRPQTYNYSSKSSSITIDFSFTITKVMAGRELRQAASLGRQHH